MFVIMVAGSSWVWIAGVQMSTHFDAAQAARAAEASAPLRQLPQPQAASPASASSVRAPAALSSLQVVSATDAVPAPPPPLREPPRRATVFAPPAAPGADEDDPAASAELLSWLDVRGLSYLRASLEQLGAYRPEDLARLDARDQRCAAGKHTRGPSNLGDGLEDLLCGFGAGAHAGVSALTLLCASARSSSFFLFLFVITFITGGYGWKRVWAPVRVGSTTRARWQPGSAASRTSWQLPARQQQQLLQLPQQELQQQQQRRHRHRSLLPCRLPELL